MDTIRALLFCTPPRRKSPDNLGISGFSHTICCRECVRNVSLFTDFPLRELDVIAGLIRKCIDENSATAQDQTEYTSRYNAYVDRYEKAKARYDSLAANRQDKLAGAKAVERFMAVLDERDDPLTEFDRHLWIMTVDYATVHRDGTITFRFYDGTEITK